MSEIRVDNERGLIEEIRQSNAYKRFKKRELQPKIDREKEAWRLLEKYRGQYTLEVLNQIFDKVDLYDGSKRWFGAMLAMPNRNLIFESGLEIINQWIETLLFSGQSPEMALNTCLKELKIKGASKGLASLLLYLSNPEKFNIWVNTTEYGLAILGRGGEFKGNEWGDNYNNFNKYANDFRVTNGFQPQEVDWILTFIAFYVESDDSSFRISEELLETDEVAIAVDDEADIDDVVGVPMELGVMRWTPTNEMGVVALFIEFRRELGFPVIEIIRTRFPDAAVFEESAKGFVRRYIEFEFKSSGYKAHLKSKRKCHYVVCWENDWKDCPLPVIELKQQIPDILEKRKK